MNFANTKLLLSGICSILCVIAFAAADISGRLRRLEDDIKDLDKKIAKAQTDSRKALTLQHQREKLALEMVHSAQLELLNAPVKADGRSRKLELLLKNEAEILEKSLNKNNSFPGLKYLTNTTGMLQDIRSGKLQFSGKISKSDSTLLREVQKKQREALTEQHKEQSRSFRK